MPGSRPEASGRPGRRAIPLGAESREGRLGASWPESTSADRCGGYLLQFLVGYARAFAARSSIAALMSGRARYSSSHSYTRKPHRLGCSRSLPPHDLSSSALIAFLPCLLPGIPLDLLPPLIPLRPVTIV